ncbi:MAG: hypothetical protein R2748_04450 [Bryobacterales bacterium]
MAVVQRAAWTLAAILVAGLALPAAETADSPAAKPVADATTAAAAKPKAQAEDSSNASASAETNGEDRRKEADPNAKGLSGIEEQDTALSQIEEAIQVFKTETERLGVRADSSGGKSRRNASVAAAWHGRVYEYIRNDSLDATPHEVVQRGGTGNILRRNQFGFSVSGPVLLPKLYDGRRSTFFTFSYEGTREKVGRSYLRTLPTAQQRGGDFSDLVNKAGDPMAIYDPASTAENANYDPTQNVSRSNLEYQREAFANNRIPLSRLDPVALAAGKNYPLPNASVGPFLRNNYWVFPVEVNQPSGFIAKVDHNLFKRHKLTVNLADSRGFQGEPRIYDTIANPARPDRRFVDQRLSVRETYAISPSAIYEMTASGTSEQVETVGLRSETNIPRELGLKGVEGSVFPSFRFNTYYGMGAPTDSYYRNAWNTYRNEHQLTLRRNKHSWSFQSEANYYQLNTLAHEAPSGALGFNDFLTGLPGVTNTGDSYATFLLGIASTARVSDVVQPSYLRRWAFQNSIRDEIQVTPNLTATLRLSIDVETPRVEKYDRQSTFDLDTINPANGRPGAMVFANQNGFGRAFQPTVTTFEPQVSISWSPTSKRDTVLRGTFMRYNTGIPLQPGAFGTQGFNGRREPLSLNTQLIPAVRFSQGFPALANPLPDLRGDVANYTDVDYVAPTTNVPRYTYLYVSLERRLPKGLTLRAMSRRYKARNLLISGDIVALNSISLDALDYRDQLNDELFRRTLRPYPQVLDLRTSQYPGGRYLYDINDISIEKRTGEGLSFDFAYQYRRRYDDYSGPGVQDPFHREASEWSLARGLRPHRIDFNYMYELPFGSGKRFLASNGVLGKVLGDWSVSGFTTWMSGDPLVLQPQFNNTGGVIRSLRVMSVAGVDPQPDNPGPSMWFNPAAFAQPDAFTAGNVPRTHPVVDEPNLAESRPSDHQARAAVVGKSIELLFQSFNFLNHASGPTRIRRSVRPTPAQRQRRQDHRLRRRQVLKSARV